MSTYYDYSLFYKNKQTKEIKAVAPELGGFFNKTLLSGWELDPLIEEADVSEDWEKQKTNSSNLSQSILRVGIQKKN